MKHKWGQSAVNTIKMKCLEGKSARPFLKKTRHKKMH